MCLIFTDMRKRWLDSSTKFYRKFNEIEIFTAWFLTNRSNTARTGPTGINPLNKNKNSPVCQFRHFLKIRICCARTVLDKDELKISLRRKPGFQIVIISIKESRFSRATFSLSPGPDGEGGQTAFVTKRNLPIPPWVKISETRKGLWLNVHVKESNNLKGRFEVFFWEKSSSFC